MNLLVISNTFPDENDEYIGGIFVKEQLKVLGKYFDNIYVVSQKPCGIGLLRKISQEDYRFGNMTRLSLNFVEKIERSLSGKHEFMINNINN
jgi:hypothetical protein